MIYNCYQLYSTLHRNSDFIFSLTENLERCYYKKRQPKKKFSENQCNKDGSIKYRDLIPPVQSLKLVQKEIVAVLQNIALPGCMYGSVAGKNNILNTLKHIENNYFLTIDLKNFFPNITNKQVHQTLVDNGFNWQVARIITKLTTHKGSLPQGSPTSPILANLVSVKLVNALQLLSEKHAITFTTFLDDLSFSSKTCFKNLIPEILRIVSNHNFFVHHKKIHYRTGRCEITGLIIDKGKLKLVPDMKTRLNSNSKLRQYYRSIEHHYKQYLQSLPHSGLQ